jgi:hypothetical protein
MDLTSDDNVSQQKCMRFQLLGVSRDGFLEAESGCLLLADFFGAADLGEALGQIRYLGARRIAGSVEGAYQSIDGHLIGRIIRKGKAALLDSSSGIAGRQVESAQDIAGQIE